MFRNKLSVCLIALLFLSFAKATDAAQLTGTGVRAPYFAEALVSSDLEYGGGRPLSDLPTLLVCVDVMTALPPDGPVSYTNNAGASALRGGSGAAGVAAIHWLFDQYYAPYFKNGDSRQQWAFQYAVWEIGNDYDGSVSSLSPSTGRSRPTTGGYFDSDPVFIHAYQTMYQAMISTFPSLPTAYRSQTYTLDLFKSTIPGQQDMVALIERAPASVTSPTPIPTLGPWAFMLLSTLLGAFSWGKLRRPRTQKRT